MDELNFTSREEARAAAHDFVRRMAEYRSALQVNRESAVSLYFENLERKGVANATLEPFHAMYRFDENRATGLSQQERASIFQVTMHDLDRVVIFCDPCTLPSWGCLRMDQLRAVLYAGDLDRAEAIALDLLGDPMWRNNDHKHFVEQILGQVSLRRGDKNEAIRYFLSSVNDGEGPVLGSFGPKMRLANELYEAGQIDAVLAYLIKIAEFWTFHTESVERWIAAIRAAKDPRDQDWRAQMTY